MLVLMTEVGMVVMKVAVCPIPAYFQTWYRLSSSKTDQKKKKKRSLKTRRNRKLSNSRERGNHLVGGEKKKKRKHTESCFLPSSCTPSYIGGDFCLLGFATICLSQLRICET